MTSRLRSRRLASPHVLPVLVLLATQGCSTPEHRTGDRPTTPGSRELADLSEGELLQGFRTEALYLDDRDRPMGARFIHEHTGFALDHLMIDTAPEGYIWVNTAPDTDKGLPHAQEHLLLGKGNKGRRSRIGTLSMAKTPKRPGSSSGAHRDLAQDGARLAFDSLGEGPIVDAIEGTPSEGTPSGSRSRTEQGHRVG